MAPKTLTISEEAYNALARLKSRDGSFTKVILRLTRKKGKGNLLEYIRSIAPDNEMADRLEKVLEERRRIRETGRGGRIVVKRFPTSEDPLRVLVGKKLFPRHVPIEELEEKLETR